MIVRLVLICVLAAAFARGFAEIIDRTDASMTQSRAGDPCAEWSNPNCNRTLFE